MGHRILVTGASGFAGGHLLTHLSGTEDLFAWSRSGQSASISNVHWQRVDLLDRASVRASIAAARPSIVYHLAGSPHVGSSWQDRTGALAHNVLGTHHLFDALRRAQTPCRVLVTGSAAVYAASVEPLTESARVLPTSPYALSKYAQEQLGLRAIAEDGLEVILTRSFNHTGPRQSEAFVAPSIARQIALIERGAVDPVLHVGNLDARRDFTDVRDVVSAYAALMERGASGEIYNVASGTAHAMRDVLDALLARARVPVRVDTDPARLRPHDTPFMVGNADKLKSATTWTPRIGFEQMIDDLLSYWRTHVGGGP